MKKRFIIFLWSFIFLIGIKSLIYGAELELSAQSGVVIDTITGRVIFEKNANTQRTMASTTKIMTGILAIEKGNLKDIVKTSAHAANVEGSSMWLEEGETQTLENLIYGLLLNSGNDAAIAIAEHIAGDVVGFAEMMTQKAIEIGAVNTSFKNPNGLDEEGHYTTAYDLALITRYALKNKKFAEIVKTKEKRIPWEGRQWDRVLKNHNKLLNMYEGCDGVKTGFTKKSGRCLVSSATRDSWQVIVVTLNASNDWEDHKKMLDYAFKHYNFQDILQKDQYAKTLPVLDGKEDVISLINTDGVSLPLKEDEKDKIRIEYTVPDYVMAPIDFNQKIGKISVYLEDIHCVDIPLVSTSYVEKQDVKLIFKKIVENWLWIFSNHKTRYECLENHVGI